MEKEGIAVISYGEYNFPYNPERFQIRDSRNLKTYYSPLAGCIQQDLGRMMRQVEGEGAFYGENALLCYQQLRAAYLQGGTRLLYLPENDPFPAYFTALTVQGEAGPKLVRYAFAFCEAPEQARAPAAYLSYTAKDGTVFVSGQEETGGEP